MAELARSELLEGGSVPNPCRGQVVDNVLLASLVTGLVDTYLCYPDRIRFPDSSA